MSTSKEGTAPTKGNGKIKITLTRDEGMVVEGVRQTKVRPIIVNSGEVGSTLRNFLLTKKQIERLKGKMVAGKGMTQIEGEKFFRAVVITDKPLRMITDLEDEYLISITPANPTHLGVETADRDHLRDLSTNGHVRPLNP